MPHIGNVASWLRMSQMLQRRASVAAVLGLVGLAAVIVFAASIIRTQTATRENAAGSDKSWQAVAPGRVEPSSGETKITPVVVALVGEVFVRANDKVFAGEPLIRLKTMSSGPGLRRRRHRLRCASACATTNAPLAKRPIGAGPRMP